MIIQNFQPYSGQHYESTTIGNLLHHQDISLSEPMIFGLGSGLGYIYWNMKMMDMPFIGGRIKPDLLTHNISNLLRLNLDILETSSLSKAWELVKNKIDQGIPVGLKLDSYYLEYFTSKIHFAAHYNTLYGYDNNFAYLIDTQQQGVRVKSKLENIAMARNAKGPMSSKNLSFTFQKAGEMHQLRDMIPIAISKNAYDYLNPPISNAGYKGILKTSKEIYKWFKNSGNRKKDFELQSTLMEKAGTGGALFRNLYCDFLRESFEITQLKPIETAWRMFATIADQWNQVASLFQLTGQTENMDYIDKASALLRSIAQNEYNAMELLKEPGFNRI